MKKIIYLALLAVGLQSCLKDKENESNIFNGVDKDKNVLIFSTLAKPVTDFQITAVDINAVPEPVLPSIGIVLKPGAQAFSIPIELPVRKLATDVVVTVTYDPAKIASYNATRVAAYNALKADYDLLKAKYDADLAFNNTTPPPATPIVLPPVPVVPELYIPYIELPVGKYTLSKSVTIKAGEQTANIAFALSAPATDLSTLNKYMLPITLSASAGVLVSNPTTLIKVEPLTFSPYIGKYAYTGVQRFQTLTGGTADYTTALVLPSVVQHVFSRSTTIPNVIQMQIGGSLTPSPAPASNTGFRMNVLFNPSAVDPEDRIIIVGATPALPPLNLTLLPSVISKVTKGPGDPALELKFDAEGNLDEIKNFWYTYSNASGERQFKQSSIKRIPE